jgi:MoaA/NifB/PqqE/SkfB family radical SAM enzyme
VSNLHRFQSLKILVHADRLRAIAEGGEPYPIEWVVFPSNVCNHKCTWCMYRQNGEQENFPDILPRETYLRFIRDAKRLGGTVVQIEGGGEPLINKATPEALALCNELGIKSALSTNGRLLTPEIAARVDYLRVSLNAGTAEQHTKTNHGGEGPGDWGEIVRRLHESLPNRRQDAGLAFVADHENYRDVVPFVELAASVGADFVHIRPAFYYDAEKDAAVRAVMPELFAGCEEAKRRFGDRVQVFAIAEKFDGYWTPRSYDRCRAVWTGVVLRATGDFAVCKDRTDLVWGKDPSYSAGASFESCWHSDERRRLVGTLHGSLGGELINCPRCVWNTRNQVIEDVFMNDSMRLALV